MKSNNKEIIIGAIIIGVIVIAAIAVAIILLTSEDPLSGGDAKSLTLDQLNISEEIIIGEEKIAALTATAKNIKDDLVWSSSNTKVATVEGAGDTAIITLKGAGQAVITVTAGELKAECQVTVKELESKLTLTPNSMTEGLVAGSTKVITIAAILENLTGNVKWSVNDDKVATIKGNGETAELTLKKAGDVVVTAKVGDKTATCNVKVEDVKSMITLNTTSINEKIKKGETVTKTLEVKLLNVTQDLKWSSSNPAVAKVEKIDAKKAKVTVVGEGTAIITVTDGTVKATCSVKATLTKPSLTLNKTTIKESIIIGDAKTLKDVLTATLKDGKGSITWTSSNEKVVTVKDNGNKASINVLRSGTSTITAKCTIDGATYKATCVVAVAYLQPSLTLNKTAVTEGLLTGDNKTLTDVLTATLKDAKGSITWTSSDDKVVTVVPNGMKATLKLNKPGTATITATYSVDGVVCTAKCKVTINEVKPEITLNSSSVNKSIIEGYSEEQTITVTKLLNIPDDATVEWTSSNEKVATVKGNEKSATIVFVSKGTADITATVKYKGRTLDTATCKVTVSYLETKIAPGKEQTLAIGVVATIEFKVTNLPKNAELVWKVDSSTDAVKTESQTVTLGKEAGTATAVIKLKSGVAANAKVTLKYGSINANVSVKWVEPYFESLTISKGNMTTYKLEEETAKLYFEANVDYLGSQKVKWVVESTNGGTANIAATKNDGTEAVLTVTKGGTFVVRANVGDSTKEIDNIKVIDTKIEIDSAAKTHYIGEEGQVFVKVSNFHNSVISTGTFSIESGKNVLTDTGVSERDGEYYFHYKVVSTGTATVKFTIGDKTKTFKITGNKPGLYLTATKKTGVLSAGDPNYYVTADYTDSVAGYTLEWNAYCVAEDGSLSNEGIFKTWLSHSNKRFNLSIKPGAYRVTCRLSYNGVSLAYEEVDFTLL